MRSRIYSSLFVLTCLLANCSESLAQFELESLDRQGDTGGGGGSGSDSDISGKTITEIKKEEAGTAFNRNTIDYQANLILPMNEPALSRALAEDGGGGSGGSGGGLAGDRQGETGGGTGGGGSKMPDPYNKDGIKQDAYRIPPALALINVLQGDAYKKLLSKNFKEKLIADAVAKMNTEPAAYDAALKMVNLANGFLDTTLSAVDMARQQYLDADPTGVLALQFDSCMAINSSGDKDQGGLPAAVSVCMGDAGEPNPKAKNKFDEFNKDKKAGFGPGDRPAKQEGGAQSAADRQDFLPGALGLGGFLNNLGAGKGGPEGKWKLTEELFPESKGGNGADGDAGGGEGTIQEVSESFKKLVGDVKFDAPVEVTDPRIKFQQIDEKATEADKIIKETIEKDVYKTLNEVMKEYCKFKKEGTENSSKEPYNFDMIIFWQDKNKVTDEKYKKLSTPGFRFTPVTGELLFRAFQKDQDDEKMECDKIGQKTTLPKESDSDVEDWMWIYASYAKRVGWGQVLARYERLHNFTERFITRRYQEYHVERLFERVLSKGPVQDFFMAQQANRAELLKFLQELGHYMQNKIGQGGPMQPNHFNATVSFGGDEADPFGGSAQN